jgi:hypothetical protein
VNVDTGQWAALTAEASGWRDDATALADAVLVLLHRAVAEPEPAPRRRGRGRHAASRTHLRLIQGGDARP